MKTVDIHEAQAQLSCLVQAAARGDAFIIARAGQPVVKVVPIGAEEDPTAEPIGFMRGEIDVPDDFDTMGGESTPIGEQRTDGG